MTHPTTKSRKPLPLFYVGDRARVNVFGLHGSDRKGEVVFVGRKLVTVKVVDGRLMSLPFEQVDIY